MRVCVCVCVRACVCGREEGARSRKRTAKRTKKLQYPSQSLSHRRATGIMYAKQAVVARGDFRELPLLRLIHCIHQEAITVHDKVSLANRREKPGTAMISRDLVRWPVNNNKSAGNLVGF